MKIAALSALALTALAAGPVLAADLPSRRAPPTYVAPQQPIPVFTWTGIFGGLNAGAAFGQAQGPYNNTGGDVPFVGGGQVGFNYQFGTSTAGLGLLSGVGNVANTFGGGLNSIGGGLFGGSGLVIGAVADAQYLNGHNGYTFAPGFNPGIAYSPTHYLGTVRGRLGVSIGRALVYGTGGYAYNLRNDGVAYGGGVEFGVTNNVSVGAEYLRIDMSRGGTSVDAFGNATNQRGNYNIVRGFVNYRFDPLQALTQGPVVARY